jgi:hypothetical protein
LIAFDWVKTFFRQQKTASGSVLIFPVPFHVGGGSSFLVSSHKTGHWERRHLSFSGSMAFPVAPWTPQRGG